MNEFLNKVWLDNTVKSYLTAIGVILFVLFFRKYISHYIAGQLYNLVNRIWKNVDKNDFKGLVVKPLGFFLLIVITLISLHRLNFPETLEVEVYKFTLKEFLQSIGTIVLVVSFVGLLIKMIEFIALLLERKANLTIDQADNQLIVFFKDFFKVMLVLLGILLVLKYAFYLDISTLLTGLSIVGAAIALALRESIENLIASFIIFFDKPFTTGDLVKVQTISGTVEKIGLRSTRIRTDQKTFVTVPNKQMVDSILDNLSMRTHRRADLKLDLDLATSPSQLQTIVDAIKQILNREEIEDDNVFVAEVSNTAISILADYYTAPIAIKDFNLLKQTVHLKVLQLLKDMQVEIAGASTTVRVENAGA